MRDLAQHLGVLPSTLQREFKNLTEAGIVASRRDGGRVYYRSSESCPIFAALVELFKPALSFQKTIRIDLMHMGALIGPGGQTIKAIQSKSGVTIDPQPNGRVVISGSDEDSIQKAIEGVQTVCREIKVGDKFWSVVVGISPKAIQVEYCFGSKGIVRLDQLAPGAQSQASDLVKIGDEVQIEVLMSDISGIHLTALGMAQKLPSLQENEHVVPSAINIDDRYRNRMADRSRDRIAERERERS